MRNLFYLINKLYKELKDLIQNNKYLLNRLLETKVVLSIKGIVNCEGQINIAKAFFSCLTGHCQYSELNDECIGKGVLDDAELLMDTLCISLHLYLHCLFLYVWLFSGEQIHTDTNACNCLNTTECQIHTQQKTGSRKHS